MKFLGEVDWQLGCNIIGTSALLAFIVIGIPLGVRDSSINNIAFIVYNVVYCSYGFVLLRLMFEYVLPGLDTRLYISLFIAVSGSVILFYMLHFLGALDMSIGLVRTVPPTITTLFVVVAYLFHASNDDSVTSSDNVTATVQVTTVATTSSPMRVVFDMENRMSLQRPIICAVPGSTEEANDSSVFGSWLGLTARSADLQGVTVIGPPLHQWARCVAVSLCLSATYMWCQWLSLTFSSTSGALGEVGVYVVFALSFSVLRPVARYAGYQLDKYKTGGPSMEMLMEMGISCFYFVFYRSLFVSVRSYAVFFAIKSIHVTMELLNHSVCFSLWYRQLLTHLFQAWKDFPIGKKALRIIAGCKSVDMFVQLQCIKSGMRLYLFLFSALTFMAFFTFLRFSYNRNYYCMYTELGSSEYAQLMNITAISVCIELAVYAGTDWMCRKSYGHGVLVTWEALLHGKLGGSHTAIIVYMIWLLAHITTDIYLSRVDVSSIGGIDCPENF